MKNEWAEMHFSGPLCASRRIYFKFKDFKLAFCRQLKWLNASLRMRCFWPCCSRRRGIIFWQEKVWEVSSFCKWKELFGLSANRLRRFSPQDLFRTAACHQQEGIVPCGSDLNIIFKRIFRLGRFWAFVNETNRAFGWCVFILWRPDGSFGGIAEWKIILLYLLKKNK